MLVGVVRKMVTQCVERDGTRIYEWRDTTLYGWWLQAGESAEARRFFPDSREAHREMTYWLRECREYRWK